MKRGVMNGREGQLKKGREWCHVTRGFKGQIKALATPPVLDPRRQLEYLWGLPQTQGKLEHSVPTV